MSMQLLFLSSSGSFVHSNFIYFYSIFYELFPSETTTLWSEDSKVVKIRT